MNYQQMTFGQLLQNQKAREILAKYLGSEMLDSPMVEGAKNMTIEGIKPHVAGMIPCELLSQIEKELAEI